MQPVYSLMKVSIIIVNYNTFDVTCNCIESVIRYTKECDYEIILVDNASTKGNADGFLARFPSIQLIKSPVNGGFAKGNNLGIAHATGDIILLLNSDTYLQEDSISKAAKQYSLLDGVSALTVRLIYPDGKLQHTARKFRSITNEILDLFRPILKLLPYKKRSQLMLNQYFNGDYDTWCDWVSGAFMMFDKNLLDPLPGKILDERFFMYGEDHLWCYQFSQFQLRCYYYSQTTVVHIHGASTDPAKQLRLQKMFINLEEEIVSYRKGRSLYYYIFCFIFSAKENLRHSIKRLFALFNVKIR